MHAEAMTSAGDFKRSIRFIVAAYKRQYPDEYKLVVDAVAMQRKLLQDPKYATIEGSDQRGLYEVSETLQAALITHLSVEALSWFKEKEGGRWFAKAFPEFRLPAQI